MLQTVVILACQKRYTRFGSNLVIILYQPPRGILCRGPYTIKNRLVHCTIFSLKGNGKRKISSVYDPAK